MCVWLLFKVKTKEGGHDVDCEILIPKFRSTDRACIKSEGLVFHGTGRAIRLINSLLHEERPKNYSENLSRIRGQFSKQSSSRNMSKKSFSQGFPLWHYHIISAKTAGNWLAAELKEGHPKACV